MYPTIQFNLILLTFLKVDHVRFQSVTYIFDIGLVLKLRYPAGRWRTKPTRFSFAAACTFPSVCVMSPESFMISQRLDLRGLCVRKPQVAASVW